MLKAKGISIALVNLTYGTNLGIGSQWPRTNRVNEKDKINDAFAAARDNAADYTIVLPHWGTEYELKHSKEQERLAAWFAEQGADCIIGAHPHVVQDADTIGRVPVAYSLGNAVSNMSATNTQMGLMATIRLIRQENGDIRIQPLEMEYLWCSRPGGFATDYIVIPVRDYIGKSDKWLNQSDYHKMIATYERVRKETGIQ